MTLVRGVFISILATASAAHAQGVTRRYAEEPTSGMALPLAPMAGEHDARTVAVNPGGLALVRGTELALALGIEDPDVAIDDGQGVGAFLAGSIGGGLLPRLAVGVGLEWLRPPRDRLLVDPEKPFRFTLGAAGALGPNTGLGVSWHHFAADGLLDGVDTFDAGLSTRVGNRLALGLGVRDIATASIGPVSVERRYEAEVMVRPLGTDGLEVAAGGRIGEDSADVDAWGRVSGRLARGLVLHVGAETRATHAFVTSPTDPSSSEDEGRDVRAMAGLELSFGRSGATAIASGLRDDTKGRHLLGGQLVIRMSTQGPASIVAPDDRIERVDLSGAIGTRELTGLVARMRGLARDSHVKAVVVTFDSVDGGWATLEELRSEIVGLRKAGKKVFAYMVSGTGRDYFVATAADKIYVDPAGGVRIVGMAGTSLYFRGGFDLIGVTPQFERIGEYKAAPEQFTQRGPSAPAKQMQNELFDSLYERYIDAIAQARKLTPADVKALVDNGPYTAGDLTKDKKLVDAVAAPERVAQLIGAELGEAYPIGTISPPRPDRWERPQVAVIYVDGDIIDGKSRTVPLVGEQLAGSETLINAIVAARANPRVGAIILRIDSPGGSALASELISREVFATRGIKPILCSLGDVAASGGYFIAAGCEVIYADPMSITGSIGIFFGKFDVSGLIGKLGIGVEVYKRGARADVEGYFRPWTDEERAVLGDKMRYMYGRFISAVAEGRGMTKEAVDAAGRGHVYTGVQAKQVKLIDKFGGFADVLDDAKVRMGLHVTDRVQLIELPVIKTSFLTKLSRFAGASAEEIDSTAALSSLPILRELVRGLPASIMVQPGVAQARLPFDIATE